MAADGLDLVDGLAVVGEVGQAPVYRAVAEVQKLDRDAPLETG